MEEDTIIAFIECATWDDPRGRHMEFSDPEADISIRVSVGRKEVDPDIQSTHMVGMLHELPNLVGETISRHTERCEGCGEFHD